jgi:hypothetical protein
VIYTGVSDEYRNRLLQRALGGYPELWGDTLNKRMSYRWNLRKIMATRDMFATTDLVPLSADRGTHLSREKSSVW